LSNYGALGEDKAIAFSTITVVFFLNNEARKTKSTLRTQQIFTAVVAPEFAVSTIVKKVIRPTMMRKFPDLTSD